MRDDRDDGPATYQLYDARRPDSSPSCWSTVRHSPRYPLAPMEAVHGDRPRRARAARLPDRPGRRRTSGLPTVLVVHGGPWARDTWGYNAEVQWLANRGYLVLQVNFRGSTGYGKAFVNAGDREWGAAMHDDLLDTVAWAVDAGLRRPGSGRDLRRVLRRVRGARRGDAHPRGLRLRRRPRRSVEPADPDRVGPALLGADDRPVPRAHRPPRTRRRPALASGRRCRVPTRCRSRC